LSKSKYVVLADNLAFATYNNTPQNALKGESWQKPRRNLRESHDGH